MKYFYTDPLAAAWMAKHHGMKTKSHSVLNGIVDDQISDYLMDADVGSDCHYYIHPDSLHLLEPQVGDVISGIGGSGKLRTRIVQEVIEGAEDNASALIAKGCTIIQRNGIAFMWPEGE